MIEKRTKRSKSHINISTWLKDNHTHIPLAKPMLQRQFFLPWTHVSLHGFFWLLIRPGNFTSEAKLAVPPMMHFSNIWYKLYSSSNGHCHRPHSYPRNGHVHQQYRTRHHHLPSWWTSILESRMPSIGTRDLLARHFWADTMFRSVQSVFQTNGNRHRRLLIISECGSAFVNNLSWLAARPSTASLLQKLNEGEEYIHPGHTSVCLQWNQSNLSNWETPIKWSKHFSRKFSFLRPYLN